MGPQHPSTHGVLQIITEIEGEIVTKASPEIGYLHTGIEKSAENLFWSQASTVIERMDYLSPLSNALCYYLAVERLLGIGDKIPPRAQQVRVLLCELSRIASHCVWLGTGGIDLGALTGFFYCFDLRERILDLFEASGGARMHPNYIRVGGLGRDLPDGFLAQLDRVIAMYEPRMRDLRRLLQKNPILQDRMIDVGIISADDAVAWSLTGPTLRATGIPYDVRRAFPYSGYESYEFDVPTRTEGDAYARFLVRLDEMDEAMRIIRQVRKQLDTPGSWQIPDTKFAPPPKETIAGVGVVPRPSRRRVPGGRGPARRAGLLRRLQRRQPSLARAHAAAVDVQPPSAEEDRGRRADRRHGRDDRFARPRLRRSRPLTLDR
jgi:NADH-quinone oxidoreductase subunit D